MINTQTDVFDEKEGKKADFIAYLTNRVPYLDTAEKKYHLLTKEKVSELIKKANAEGNDLKALELLEAAKNSFGFPAKIDSAKIISKSLRIPGDVHLKLLASAYDTHPSGDNVAVSSSISEKVIVGMPQIFEELKKYKEVDKDKLNQIVNVFEVWRTAIKSAITQSNIKEASGKQTGVIEPYFTVFSNAYLEYGLGKRGTADLEQHILKHIDDEHHKIPATDLHPLSEGVHSFTHMLLRKEYSQAGIPHEIIDKILSSFSFERSDECFLDDPDMWQSFQPNPKDNKKKKYSLRFAYPTIITIKSNTELLEEIGEEYYQKFKAVIPTEDDLDEDDSDTITDAPDFEYEAELTIKDDKTLFKDMPLSKENEEIIVKEILTDLCNSCGFETVPISDLNTEFERFMESNDFDRAADIKRKIVKYKSLVSLARCLADSLIDVLKTSKVVTFVMPAGLNGVFEAYRSFILESVTSKKTTKEGAKQ